jgi:hypothetical protein
MACAVGQLYFYQNMALVAIPFAFLEISCISAISVEEYRLVVPSVVYKVHAQRRN